LVSWLLVDQFEHDVPPPVNRPESAWTSHRRPPAAVPALGPQARQMAAPVEADLDMARS